MNWFKDLFIRKDSQAESLPPIPERKPNISEPVLSFVETFKANPKRFKVVLESIEEDNQARFKYFLLDKQNGKRWRFSILEIFYSITHYKENILQSHPSFLSHDEADYIFDSLKEYYFSRIRKMNKIKADRLFAKENKAKLDFYRTYQ